MTDSAIALPQTRGLAAIARLVYEGGDLSATAEALIERALATPPDVAALMDLSMLVQLTGNAEGGLQMQDQALQAQRLFETRRGEGLTVLAVMTPGDFMANTPLDFLLEGSDARLLSLYVDPDAADFGLAGLGGLPAHDVAFFAIGESPVAGPLLHSLAPLAKAWPRPMVNAHPERIAALTRDAVSAAFAASAHLLSPATWRLSREDLQAVCDGRPGQVRFPLIIRPDGSHAGKSLDKADDLQTLAAYLDATPGDLFFVSDFIDYSGPDGLFRKQRIVFIDGVAYPSHFAVSEHWIVHYLSAGMKDQPERRAEEAAWMRDFDTDFARRHAAAFADLCGAVGLDYFGIDCGETSDGQLLVFEIDVAMIVHALDDEETFPYKKQPMARLSAAFLNLLSARAQGRR